MQYQYQNIQTIDQSGIVMSDGFKISFQECNQTWKRMKNVEASSCVGERDITADSPYFRFFMNEKIIEILCTGKGLFKRQQGQRNFEHLQQMLLQLGYSTYDMS